MITPFSPVQAQINEYFPPSTHPYRLLQAAIDQAVSPDADVLDIGCGRNAPMLRRLAGRTRSRYGIDLVEFVSSDPEVTLVNADVCHMPFLGDNSIDVAFSRSVMEHIEDVESAYKELYRVLRPGGKYLFLTPNRWHYVPIIASIIPNKWHPQIVKMVSDRVEEDVFPTFYRANTGSDIRGLSHSAGFRIDRLEYLTQYPAYFVFSKTLFWVGCQYERLLRSFHSLSGMRGWLFCVIEKPPAAESVATKTEDA